MNSTDPALDTVLTTDFGTDTAVPVKVRFYGPITTISGSFNNGSDVVVECIPLSAASSPCNSGFTWQQITSGFNVRGPADSQINNAYTIGLSRANSSTHIGAGLYRVRFPGVKSGGVAGMPTIVASEYCSGDASSKAYYFRVGANCDGDTLDDSIDPAIENNNFCMTGCGDFNHVNGVTVQDVFDFLDAWFSLCTTTTPSGPCQYGTADINHSGSVDVQDIFDFLTAWFNGPAGC